MTDRPILFSGPMVRGIIEDRKTQTRRVLKPQPSNHYQLRLSVVLHGVAIFRNNAIGWRQDIPLPYAIGDRLWVRESVALGYGDNGSHGYKADWKRDAMDGIAPEPKWRPSIHMPRTASRLTLIVKDLRVERVQDISVDDVVAEGIDLEGEHADEFSQAEMVAAVGGSTGCSVPEVYPFRNLWDSLNASRGFGWEANPWVVAVTFRTVHANIDKVAA